MRIGKENGKVVKAKKWMRSKDLTMHTISNSRGCLSHVKKDFFFEARSQTEKIHEHHEVTARNARDQIKVFEWVKSHACVVWSVVVCIVNGTYNDDFLLHIYRVRNIHFYCICYFICLWSCMIWYLYMVVEDSPSVCRLGLTIWLDSMFLSRCMMFRLKGIQKRVKITTTKKDQHTFENHSPKVWADLLLLFLY